MICGYHTPGQIKEFPSDETEKNFLETANIFLFTDITYGSRLIMTIFLEEVKYFHGLTIVRNFFFGGELLLKFVRLVETSPAAGRFAAVV